MSKAAVSANGDLYLANQFVPMAEHPYYIFAFDPRQNYALVDTIRVASPGALMVFFHTF